MRKSVSTTDALQRHIQQSRRIYVFLIVGVVLVLFLFWWYVRPIVELARLGLGDEITIDATMASKAKNISYGDISPSAWAQFKDTLGERRLVARTTKVTNPTREVRETRKVQQTEIVQPVDGTYITPYTSIENGQFIGSFAGGFSLKNGSIVLGETTTGDYIQELLAGDGFGVSLNNRTVTMTLVVSDGIEVAPSGIAVKAALGGGLAVTSSGVSLMSGCSDGEMLKWSNSLDSWECSVDAVGAGGVSARETDGSPSILDVSRFDFGPSSGSSSEFIVTDQGGGVVRIRLGSDVPLLSASTTVTGAWTFGSSLTASGGVTCTDCIALGSETSGAYIGDITAGSGISVTGSDGENSTLSIGLDNSLAMFKTITTSGGTSPVADGLTDMLTLASGNGVNVTGSAATDTATFSVALLDGGGLSVSASGLSLQSCGEGQIMKYLSGSWSCATDSNSVLATAYAQQLAGTDNVSVGSSATPLLTNGSGTAQSLGVAITSGNEVALTATVQFTSSVSAGAVNYTIIRDDNHDNDCATDGGDGTQIGGTVSDYIVSVGQSFTTSFNFVDTSPTAGTNYYQMCGSTGIALGTRAATNRMVTLEEVNY